VHINCECEVVQWCIKDMTGRVVLQGVELSGPIAVGDLPSGMYLVEVNDKRGFYNRQKLIISR
jgi:hypothetical protein